MNALNLPRKPLKHKRSEQESVEKQQLFYAAFHSSPTAIALSRLVDGRFIQVNQRFLALTGYRFDEVIGRTSSEAGITADPSAREARLAALQQGKPLPTFEVDVIRKSGEVRSGLATVTVVTINGEQFALSTFIDITERKQAERQVAQMKRLYATLSQVNQTIVRVHEQRELYQSICNVAVEFGEFSMAWIGLLDEASGEIRPVAANGIDVAQWPFEAVNIHRGASKDGLAATAIRTGNVVTSEDIQTDKRLQNQHNSLQDFIFHSSAAVPFHLDGKMIGVLGLVSSEMGLFKAQEELHLLTEMGQDISFALNMMEVEAARKQAKRQVIQLKRLYATLSQVNHTIVRVRTRDDLFQSICDVAVKFGGFFRAWISLLDESTRDVKPVAANGLDLAQWPFPIINLSTSDQDGGTVTAFRTSSVVTTNDIQRDVRARAIHQINHATDYHSAAVVPFQLRGHTIGTLVLMSSEVDVFNAEEEIHLLEEMGQDISFALDTMEVEAARKQAERQVIQLKRLYATLSQVNQTIVRVHEQHELYQSICDLAVQFGQFSLAWIGLLDEASGDVRPVAAHGLDVAHWPFETVNIHQGRFKDGLVASAIRSASVVTSEDIQIDPRAKQIHAQLVAQFAFHSSAVVPFRLNGKTIGTLALISSEAGLFNAQEEVLLLTEIGLDISFALDTMAVEAAHKQAELQLEKSEQRFRTAFDNMLEGTQILGFDWRYRYLNQSAEVHNRRPNSELLGNVYMEMWPGIEATHVFAVIKRCMEERIHVEIENEFVYPDGAIGWFDLRVQPIPEGILILSVDITERKRIEAMRDKLASIVEASEDAILSKTLDGIVTSWNRGSEQLYGYSAEEAMGQSIAFIIPSDRPHELPDILEHIRRGEYIKHYETVRVRKDGTLVDISITVSPMLDQAGNIVGASTIARDITERKNAERKLSENEAQLRAVHEALAEGVVFMDANGKIVSKNESVEKVLGCSLEELNDPAPNPRWRMIHSDGVPFLVNEQPAYVALHSGQSVRNVEMGVSARNGNLKWAMVNAQLVRDLVLGTTLGVVVSFFDITDRKQAEEQIRNQLQHLNSLREVDTAILSTFNMRIGLDAVVSRAVIELKVDAADVLVLNPTTGLLEYRSGWGFSTRAIQKHILRLGEGLAGRVAQDKEPIYIQDLRSHSDLFTRKRMLIEEGFIGYYCVPLIDQMEVKGVLEIFHRAPLKPNQDWIDFLHILAGQAAIAIQSATLFSGLQHSNMELAQAYDATIAGWSRAMDLRDKETAGHTQRVTEFTLELARALGMSDEALVHIRRGALLHDMGKLGVPDNVLLKPGKLTDEEWVAMRKHPQYAYDMFSSIDYLRPALDIPYCHHEKWDGTGYPRGLHGEEIPLSARLFAVVDVWDALRSDRPYRPSWPQEKVLQYIREQSGTHFDPQAVALFLHVMSEKEHDFHAEA